MSLTMKLNVLFWVLLVAVLSTCYGAPTPPSAPATPPITFYRAVLTWPNGFCMTSRCTGALPSSFVMHGVWPANGTGHSVEFCSGQPVFNENIVSTIKSQLNTYWPGLTKRNNQMWVDEWSKHGTCSKIIMIDYFRTGLALCKRLSKDINTAFSKQRIQSGPSQHYTPQAYFNALTSHFRYQPQIRCVENSASIKYLSEIVFCFDLRFKLSDCPGRGQFSPACGPATSTVYFI